MFASSVSSPRRALITANFIHIYLHEDINIPVRNYVYT